MRIDSPFLFESESPSTLGRLLAAMGKQQPVYYDEEKGFWVVLRHRDVLAGLRNSEVFSASFYSSGPVGDTFIATDGPDHIKYRRMFSRSFVPMALGRAVKDVIEPAARRTIDAMMGAGACDLIDAFCYPLPIAVLTHGLGVPTGFIEECAEWTTAMLAWNVWLKDPVIVARGKAAKGKIMEKLRPYVEQQIASPGPNIIGDFVRAMREDGSLDPELVLKVASGAVMGGYESTSWSLAGALSALLMHPEALERVRRDRSLLMPAVEESMRWANGTLGAPRHTTREVEIDGVRIPQGSSVLLCTASAHFDESVYPSPEVFDIDRRTPHLLFGSGSHVCVGASLARMEAQVGLSMLLDQLPDLRLDTSQPLRCAVGVRDSAMHGPVSLPALYTPQRELIAA
jgi:cytochrome P450